MEFVMKVSKLCNLRCVYCYEYDDLGNKERMDLENLGFFFDSLGQYLGSLNRKDEVTFVFHGGEPLLLPHEYLWRLVELQEEHLSKRGIAFKNLLQTNLYSISDATLDLLQDLGIQVGVSIDVFGEQRLTLRGQDSQKRVLKNIQRMIDRRMPMGAICVLHSQNINDIYKTLYFFNSLRIDIRILPIFSFEEVPDRMKHLMLTHQQVLSTFMALSKIVFDSKTNIIVEPLQSYFETAVRFLSGQIVEEYNPLLEEVVMMVDTNGDLYSTSDPYLPEGYMGNVFKNRFLDVMHSSERERVISTRMSRIDVCRKCKYINRCDQFGFVEGMPTDRLVNEFGEIQCSIVKPMVDFIAELIKESPHCHSILQLHAELQKHSIKV